MKKAIIALVAAVLCSVTMSAQDDKNLLNHVAVGVTAGTTGVGVDVAVPVGNYIQLRAGYAAMPKLKMGTTLDISEAVGDYSSYGVPKEIDVEGKLNIGNAKVLADIFPSKNSSFHFTVGAYFGADNIVDVYNQNNGALKKVTEWNSMFPNDKIGLELGDYLLTPDQQGNVSASIKTAGFKPYVGLGFGRAVPKKRVGFMFELGTQFWGSPKVFLNGDGGEHELVANDVNGDGGDALKILSKVSIYPVMNFRLCFRLF